MAKLPVKQRARRIYDQDGNVNVAQGRQDLLDAGTDFENEGPELYEQGEDIAFDQLGPGRSGRVKADQGMEQYQLDALEDMKAKAREGLTARDRANMNARSRRVAADANSRNEGIAADFRSRGGPSGNEAIARIAANNAADERASMEAMEESAQSEEAKRASIGALGEMAARKQEAMYGRDVRAAEADDEVERYNNGVLNQAKEMNYTRRNTTADSNVDIGNQNRKDVYDVRTKTATLQNDMGADQVLKKQQEEAARKAAKAKKRGAWGSALGAVAGGVVGTVVAPGLGTAAGAKMGSELGGSIASDKKLKENVQDENDVELDEFLALLKGKNYDYVDGEGEDGNNKNKTGILADDLVKSGIGRKMVREREDGMKEVDVKDAISTLLATVAHLNKKIERNR